MPGTVPFSLGKAEVSWCQGEPELKVGSTWSTLRSLDLYFKARVLCKPCLEAGGLGSKRG